MNDERLSVMLRLGPGLAALALIAAVLLAGRSPMPRSVAPAPGFRTADPASSQLAQALQKSLPLGRPPSSAWGPEARP